MKIKFIVLTGILILLVLFFNSSDKKEVVEFDPLEVEVGREFTQMKNDKPKIVLNYAFFDITGEEKNKMIMVIGEQTEEDMYYKNLDIVIYDTYAKKFISKSLKDFEGGVIKINNVDFDGNNVDEIMLVSENLDKTKNIRILKNNSGDLMELFNEKNNKGINGDGYFQDGFKSVLYLKNLNKELIYNLEDYKGNYISSGFFAENGKLISDKKKVSISNFTEIELVKLSESYGLKTKQKVKGFDNLDILDEIEILWKYEAGKWLICEANSLKHGNLLY